MSEALYARSFSTVTLGLSLGATCWAGFAVMPSLIAAPTSTNAKIACFNGLIDSAAKLLSPVALLSMASLGASAYLANTVQGQRGFLVAGAAQLLMIALQIPIVPRNKAMQRLLQEKKTEYDTDNGAEGARRIGEIRDLNYGRIALALLAMVACVYATDQESANTGLAGLESSIGSGSSGLRSGWTNEMPLAAKKPEYGLE